MFRLHFGSLKYYLGVLLSLLLLSWDCKSSAKWLEEFLLAQEPLEAPASCSPSTPNILPWDSSLFLGSS